jgi:hypothetical protein
MRSAVCVQLRATLVALAAMAAFGGAARADVPVPDQDPFYAVPTGIAGLPNGKLLNSRPISASFYGIPMLASAWQVQYKTLDSQDRPTADVATILVPNTPWTGGGQRPLVSYQTAEDGVGSKCSPSYALRAGLSAISSNSELETGLIELALLRGWAVTAPDYEGRYSEFLGAGGEAHGVLDGIRAALAFGPAGFTTRTPVGLWGYSGGALASDLAAMAQPTYAPELKFAGIVLGGVVTDLRATMDGFSGSALGGALVIGFVGVNRSYPQFHLLQYLNVNGHQAVAAAQTDCINDAAGRFPFAKESDFGRYPGVFNQPAVVSIFHRISPLWIPGTPSAPIYDYHSVLDEFAPIAGDRRLMARYCAAGVPVEHVEDLLSEHITLTATGALGALTYLGDRFAGRPVPQNCPGPHRRTLHVL